MDKLLLIDKLSLMYISGALHLDDEATSIEMALLEIKQIVRQSICNEIWEIITSPQTGFYAPEYNSWKEYLAACNANSDYRIVLDELFDESELDELWNCSHIEEELSEEQIKEDLLLQIGQLKMMDLLERIKCKPVDIEKHNKMIRIIKARLKGLYNLLYEG